MVGHNKNEIQSKKRGMEIDASQPFVYQIRIKGHLSRRWTDRFEGMTITLEDNGDTLISGPVVDQAALYGYLRKVRDLGMPLLSVNIIRLGQTAEADGNQ
jgi:hypothetical protein